MPFIVESCKYLWGHALPAPAKTATPIAAVAYEPQVTIKTLPDLEYAKVGGKSMMLDLYLPEKAAGKLPVIVWVHGGGWMGGDRKNPPGMDLVRRGYALASIEYRLSGEAKWPAQMYDLKGAIRWLRAHADQYGLDPQHFAAWGHSAGGHLVAMLGVTGGVKELEGDEGGNLDQSSAVQAVSDWAGPTDFLTLGPWHEGPDSGPSLLLGVVVRDNHEKALKASPVTYVSRDAAPFLIVHGERDSLVAVGQAYELGDLLTKAGVPVTMAIRPWTDHGIADPMVTAIQNEFFDRYLRERK
jgi:acetyl esterase/lipase